MMAELTIRRIRARAVDVPMRRPLGTSLGRITSAPLVLVDLETEEGVAGHAYLFCYRRSATFGVRAFIADIDEILRGAPVAPMHFETQLRRRFRLLGSEGLLEMAFSAVDVACWDALARAANTPLVRLLGGVPTRVPAYNSNGLGLMESPELAGNEAVSLLADGFDALKIRLGYLTLEADLEALHSVRAAVPSGTWIACDFNQGLGRSEALRRGRALDSEGLAWIEEPIVYDDFEGSAHIARVCTTPIQVGENFVGIRMMARALAVHASDLVMPDLERIGGVTGWMRAAALSAAHDMPMSSHLFPEVSAHLLAVTPTRDRLEYVDWAAPILTAPLAIEDGHAIVADMPGNGLCWDEEAVARWAFE